MLDFVMKFTNTLALLRATWKEGQILSPAKATGKDEQGVRQGEEKEHVSYVVKYGLVGIVIIVSLCIFYVCLMFISFLKRSVTTPIGCVPGSTNCSDSITRLFVELIYPNICLGVDKYMQCCCLSLFR